MNFFRAMLFAWALVLVRLASPTSATASLLKSPATPTSYDFTGDLLKSQATPTSCADEIMKQILNAWTLVRVRVTSPTSATVSLLKSPAIPTSYNFTGDLLKSQATPTSYADEIMEQRLNASLSYKKLEFISMSSPTSDESKSEEEDGDDMEGGGGGGGDAGNNEDPLAPNGGAESGESTGDDEGAGEGTGDDEGAGEEEGAGEDDGAGEDEGAGEGAGEDEVAGKGEDDEDDKTTEKEKDEEEEEEDCHRRKGRRASAYERRLDAQNAEIIRSTKEEITRVIEEGYEIPPPVMMIRPDPTPNPTPEHRAKVNS